MEFSKYLWNTTNWILDESWSDGGKTLHTFIESNWGRKKLDGLIEVPDDFHSNAAKSIKKCKKYIMFGRVELQF